MGTAEQHETGEFESPRVSQDFKQAAKDTAPDTNSDNPAVAQLQAEHKAAETRWQEELHLYIERIDALQSKLKYLAKEAAESARKAAATAEPGSVEKQLREKDEKIALLFEEGQKLSKSEMDHRTAIKKLRQQLADNSKIQMETKKRTEKLERELANFEARAKRAEAAEKRASESLSSQTKVARDLEAVANERNALSQTVQEMKAQFARAVARAEAAEAKAASDVLEKEKQRTAQLEEELAGVKIEREINEEKLRREVADLKEGIEQEKEKARILEAELKGEQSVLESKMEALRSKAEEASSGSTGETQAKLLRQIETLQTQYAVASENWQTLEGSLLSRLANVEKERDDVARREGEMRRKMREVVSTAFTVS
jgi:ribosomal protein L25 (general stress protein Ctc)